MPVLSTLLSLVGSATCVSGGLKKVVISSLKKSRLQIAKLDLKANKTFAPSEQTHRKTLLLMDPRHVEVLKYS